MASNTLLFRHQVATDIKKLELCPGRDFRIGIRDSFPFPSLLLPGESHTQFTPSIGRHEGPSKTSNNPDRNCRQGWRHHLYRRHQDEDDYAHDHQSQRARLPRALLSRFEVRSRYDSVPHPHRQTVQPFQDRMERPCSKQRQQGLLRPQVCQDDGEQLVKNQADGDQKPAAEK